MTLAWGLLPFLKTSLAVGGVILLVLLLSPRLNRRYVSRWKYWVWLLLALRLLIPAEPALSAPPVRLPAPDLTVELVGPAEGEAQGGAPGAPVLPGTGATQGDPAPAPRSKGPGRG